MSETEKAPEPLVVLTVAETSLLIRESSPARPLPLMFGPGRVVIHPKHLAGGWARERILQVRAEAEAAKHHTAVCPSCDQERYDEAAGFCEECGFEGFDGDQD